MAALIQSIVIQILITVIAVAGIYVLTGLTGMFSLGSAAFMAIGSYASGLLVVRAGLPVPLAFLLAIVLSVLIGFIVGLPTVRLRRDYISLVTLGFGEAIIALLNSATTLTGGAQRLCRHPPGGHSAPGHCLRRRGGSPWWPGSRPPSTAASASPSRATSWPPRPWASMSPGSR